MSDTFKSLQNTSKTIAVLGANGRLSREVARAFHAQGWQVIAITRNGKSPVLSGCDGMRFAAADALDRQSLIDATNGADVIFNGLNPSSYTEWEEKALPMAENALAAVRACGALQLFPGNVYNFGSSLPAELTPQTPFAPDHSKAHIRCRIEAMFREASRNESIRTVIVRAGDYFGGDGKGSWLDLIIAKDIEKGKVTLPGRQDIVHAWAYLPDLAKAFVRLAESADELAPFEVFHFEGHNVSGNELFGAIEAAVGTKLRKSALPHLFLQVAGLFSPLMRSVSTMFYLWKRPHAVKDDRLAQVIGPLPHTPLEQAVAKALAAQGWSQTMHRTNLSPLRWRSLPPVK